MAFFNDLSDRSDHKTIDRDRRIVLRPYNSGGPEGMPVFEVDWHEASFRFQAKHEPSRLVQQPTAETPATFDFGWEVTAIDVPENFPETRSSICDVIKEALTAFGECHSSDRVNSVEVEFRQGAFEKEPSPFFTDIQRFFVTLTKKYGWPKPRNMREEVDLTRRAAEQGDPEAQMRLGDFYYLGQRGVLKRNLAESLKWYSLSANSGYDPARAKLTQDSKTFMSWLNLALEGNPICQSDVAEYYEVGYGTSKDYREAYFWRSIVTQREKSEEAVARRDALKEFLTPEEVIAIQRRVKEWKPISDRYTKEAL